MTIAENKTYDKIIIGAGLYGLYAALFSARKGERVLVLEYDPAPFSRATYVNQARVHMGYHYPRSLTTAVKSADYFNRFVEDFSFCVHREFAQVYAISSQFSWTDGRQFADFCRAAGIPCEEVPVSRYFKPGMCEAAYLTKEYTYDAGMLGRYFIDQLQACPNVDFIFCARIARIVKTSSNTIQDNSTLSANISNSQNLQMQNLQVQQNMQIQRDLDKNREQNNQINSGFWEVVLADGQRLTAGFILNASYASVNQVLSLLTEGNNLRETEAKTDQEDQKEVSRPLTGAFPIKYELCEIILCKPSDALLDIGITVMDGPFFSIMPFGKTGLHSLTSVTFTPHVTSYETLPVFSCQKRQQNELHNNSLYGAVPTDSTTPPNPVVSAASAEYFCTPAQLANCNTCPSRPDSTWPYMSHLADKYLREEYTYQYEKSLFSMKPILKSSEVDDSRPTAIKVISTEPPFISVLSGKINTVYDLDDYL